MNFRFLNIPVFVHPTYWIFLLLYSNIYRGFSLESIILAVVMTFSLLVHEYGHALTALFFGARPTINLEAFGGNAQYNSFGLSSKQQFIITLNGPLLESLLIALSYALLKIEIFESYYIRYFLYVTMRLNIIWCLLNLIPIAPLDGGYLARYLLEKRFGEKGYIASLFIGLACVIIAAPYLFYHRAFFFGALLIIFGFQNFQILQKFGFFAGKPNPFNSYMKAVDAIKNHDLEKAKDILIKLLKSKDMQIKNSAIESLAHIYLRENEEQKAYDLLMKADHELLKEGKCILCKLAFKRKNYELITKYSREIYDIESTYEIALLNSQAFACLNQSYYAAAWLDTASQFETANKETIADLLQNEIYDAVRNQESFKEYAGKI